MLKIENGTNKSLFTLIAVVVFGIFLSLSYWLFQDQFKGVLGSVMDGVSSGTLVTMDKSLVSEHVLVPNAESDFYFTKSMGAITGYKGTREDVVIPSTIAGISVKIIADEAFMDKGLTSVYIPDGVTIIGARSFYGLNKSTLTSVRLPEDLYSIGDNAFMYNKLTSINLPESLKIIKRSSFAVNDLIHITLPEGL